MNEDRKFTLVAELPEGFDERTVLIEGPHKTVLVIHPDKAPLVLFAGRLEEIKDVGVEPMTFTAFPSK